MVEELELALLPARLGAGLLGTFGALALLLTTLGVYGVVSHGVAQRTREIGIRRALGAGRGALLRLVVGESMTLVGIGVALGLGLALLAGRGVAVLLYGVRPGDPAILGGVAAVLAAVALLASALPLRRALRVEPVEALRRDG
jgi:ABC-type antimicrobial peptide transport system permease subunit